MMRRPVSFFRLHICLLFLLLILVSSGCNASESEQAANRSVTTGLVSDLSDRDVSDDGAIREIQFLSSTGRVKAVVSVETVSEPADLQRGLMFRKSMPFDHGMLFLMPQKKILSFWMKNTLIPLSIAFIDDDMRIVDIQKMRPLDESTHHMSSVPCRYALEMNQGWFKKNRVRTRDRVVFIQR